MAKISIQTAAGAGRVERNGLEIGFVNVNVNVLLVPCMVHLVALCSPRSPWALGLMTDTRFVSYVADSFSISYFVLCTSIEWLCVV